MTSPFLFGKIASGENFVNRTNELKKLTTNFSSCINTMIISPRRWGKSSLVKRAAEIIESDKKEVKVCFIDVFSISNEQEFYEVLVTEVLKKSSNKWEEWVKNGKEFFKSIIPVFSMGSDPGTDFSVKIEFRENQQHWIEALNLPENISKKKNLKFVICIDEFQKVAQFGDGNGFQQKLRSVWQQHQNTCYCLYGSKRHIINDIFQNKAMPFYRFGDTIYLQKIETVHWINYIEESFIKYGKTIFPQQIAHIIEIAANHPYCVQQLSHQVFTNTLNIVDNEIIDKALEEIFLYNGIMYRKEIENLSPLQINFLKVVLAKEKAITSKEVIRKYNLGTSGNINRLKQALEIKEIIDTFDKEIEFIDPFFKLWCKQNI